MKGYERNSNEGDVKYFGDSKKDMFVAAVTMMTSP